jgi:PhnB protein
VTIHLVVTDVDKKFQHAVDAGATVVVPLEDQFWGDRYGVLQDPFGHQWSMGSRCARSAWRKSKRHIEQH